MQKKGIIATYIRIPEELHKKVVESSKKNFRSWNAEVMFILQEYYDRQDDQQNVLRFRR
jgi:Arc-like DNA binding domain